MPILDRRLGRGGATDGGDATGGEGECEGERGGVNGEEECESHLKRRGEGERARDLGADFTLLWTPRPSDSLVSWKQLPDLYTQQPQTFPDQP